MGMIVLSIILIAFCSFEIINYLIEYKYHIDENFDQSDMIVSYHSRKSEMDLIIISLKVFIVYFIIITIFFSYKYFKKS